MKYIFIVFITMIAINGYGNEDERIKAHIANDFAECTAYYRIMSKGNIGNIKKYNKYREQCYAYAVELSNAADTEARVELSIKDQLKLINNDYSNTSLLTNKYDAFCESLLARRNWKGKNTSRGF
jgi:molecular chaperone DnaK (HSP70)